jgi:NitT/TauT family transport system substrate-binding protein
MIVRGEAKTFRSAESYHFLVEVEAAECEYRRVRREQRCEPELIGRGDRKLQGGKLMKAGAPTRRDAFQTVAKGASVILTLSVSAKSLGLSASAQVPDKIVLGTIPIIPTIESYVGEIDFFKEQGLTVELTRFNNFAPIMQAMAAGNLSVGEIGVAPSIIGLSRGLPLVAPFLSSFSTPNRPVERIMVLENSPIKTLDDLKGKKLAFLGPGTVPDMFLGALSKKTHIRKEDVDLVPMPAPNMPDALAQGLVDAIFAIPPADTVAEQKYKARTVANATELVPYAGLGTVALRHDFAETNPEAAKKLFQACIRLMRWIDDNDAEARRSMAENLHLPENLAMASRIPLFSRNGLPVMPNIWHLYEMLIQSKTIDPHPDPAKLFNDTIVEPTKRFTLPAVEELGLQPDPEIIKMLKGDYPFLPKPVEGYYADWERQLLKM